MLCFPFQALASSFQRTFILFPQPSLAAIFLVIGSAKVLQFFDLTSFLKKILFYFFLGVFGCEFYAFPAGVLRVLNLRFPLYPSSLVDELVPFYNTFVVFGSAKIELIVFSKQASFKINVK